VPGAGHPEFTFVLSLSHEPHVDPMLADLTGAVLRHVGYAPDAVTELSGGLERAIAGARAHGGRDCQVAFRAHRGELHIEVACDAAGRWRTSRPLP
jgi:hypothetical protein